MFESTSTSFSFTSYRTFPSYKVGITVPLTSEVSESGSWQATVHANSLSRTKIISTGALGKSVALKRKDSGRGGNSEAPIGPNRGGQQVVLRIWR